MNACHTISPNSFFTYSTLCKNFVCENKNSRVTRELSNILLN